MTNSLSPLSPLNPLFVAGGDCSDQQEPTTRTRPLQQRSPSFPPSRALRPFPSIANSLVKPQAAPSTRPPPLNASSVGRFDSTQTNQNTNKRAVKMIEPPTGNKFKGFFVLGMTQAEFRRE